MTLTISAQARDEFEQAIGYLMERNPSAAVAFHDSVLATFERVMQFPAFGAPTTHPELRRVVLTAFPYTIYYRHNANQVDVEIVSIFATARNPNKQPKY